MTTFLSDNAGGIAPRVLEALRREAAAPAPPYGDDAASERLERLMTELFETEVAVLPVVTGTAANALGLSAFVPPWGAVYCHRESHLWVDECGAPEMFTGGARLVPLPGEAGRLAAPDLAAAVDGAGDVHRVQPATVSLSQATELGTVYSLETTGAIGEVCARHGLALHLDGARLANALVHLGCSPAEATWRVGVDVLSFGATKNGCLAAEAVVLFDRERAGELALRRKRGGHLLSKMRLLSLQLEAYLADDQWLVDAARANRIARRLAAGIEQVTGVAAVHPVEANELFVRLGVGTVAELREAGWAFYDWPSAGPGAIRLVASFDTAEADVERFLADLRRVWQGSCDDPPAPRPPVRSEATFRRGPGGSPGGEGGP